MKFANINFQSTDLNDSRYIAINMGDNLQFMAVDNLYSSMKISKSEIEYLSIDNVAKYSGNEKLMLPLNWSFFDPHWMNGDKLCIAEKIVPVFLAMTLGCAYCEEMFNEHNIQYLKQHEPIGCRDMETYQTLSKHGIKAYLNGCLTSLLPKREREPKSGKVFFIDAPIELSKYVSKQYLEDGVFLSQQYYFENTISTEELEQHVKEHYRRIAEEAKLVITSRLHVASPCVAMGIPVILAKKVIDARFGWMEKYIPLYGQEKYSEIDWNPQVIDYEKGKRQLLEYNANRILFEKYKAEIAGEMNNYYGLSENHYVNFARFIRHNWTGAKEFIEKRWDKNKEIKYAVWGLIVTVDEFIEYIETEYPMAKLVKVIDAHKEGTFRGIPIEKPETIEAEDYYLFVLSVGACNEAYQMCKRKRIPEEQYYLVGDVYMQGNFEK